MTDRELMQQALEAMEYLDALQPSPDYYPEDYMEARIAITALRERLAQPEQEPVAWVTGWHDGHCVIRAANPSAILPIGIALYTTPPRREWVGLTQDELNMIGDRMRTWNSHSLVDVYTAIEAKLKEKNG